MDNAATFLRIVMLLGLVLTAVCFAIQALVAWRRISWGEKMFTVAFIAFLIYILDANRAALSAGMTWNWRLAPLGVGLASFTAYLMEPWSSRRRWLNRRNEDQTTSDS